MSHIQFPYGQPLKKRHISALLENLALIWSAVKPERAAECTRHRSRLRYFLLRLREGLEE